MQKLVLALFTVAMVFSHGCATFGPPAIDIGECAVGKVCQQVAEIKPQVLNCLNTGTYLPCLEAIGKTVGEAVLVCAVREFTGVGATPASDPIIRQRAQ